MKIKHIIAGLVILGSCPTPALALSWPKANWDKIADDSIGGIIKNVSVPLILGAAFIIYQRVNYLLYPEWAKQELLDKKNRSRKEEQSNINSNDLGLRENAIHMIELNAALSEAKDEELRQKISNKLDELKAKRFDLIVSNAILKADFAQRIQEEKAAELAQSAAENQQTAQPAPSAPAA